MRTFIVFWLFLVTTLARGGTIEVPSKVYATIQSGVDAAGPGDVVLVEGGAYRERVTISTANVTLRGDDGAMIDAEYLGPCVRVMAEGVTVEGLLLANGKPGVWVQASRALVRDNVVRSPVDFGIQVAANDARILENTVVGCDGNHVDVDAPSILSETRIERNKLRSGEGSNTIRAEGGRFVIRDNESSAHDSGLYVVPSHPSKQSIVEDNEFRGLDGEGIEIDVEHATAGLIVRSNTISGVYGPGILLDVTAPVIQVTIADNRCTGTSSSGIQIDVDTVAASVVVSGNKIRESGECGIEVDGPGIDVIDNDVAVMDDDGIFVQSFSGTVAGNKVRRAGGAGIFVYESTGAILRENDVRFVGFDGIHVEASTVTLEQNELIRNYGDGIDVATGSGVQLIGNVCLKNAHEGIDNNASNTVIDGNECKGNGAPFGPDIAGRGKGQGTVASFSGNDFGSGGPTTTQRLDQ